MRSDIRLFANDCVIYQNIENRSDAATLQEDLNTLNEWQLKWQMAFNASKCFLLRITHKTKPLSVDYTLGEDVLQQTQNHSYLGVELTQDLKWKTHINNITSKANRQLGFIKRNLLSCPQDLKAKAYITLVRPLLEYSSTVWDTHTSELIKQIESVQRRAARFAMRDYSRYSSPSSMLATLGWDTLELRRKVNRLALMHKIINDQVAIPAQTFLQPVIRPTRLQNNKAYQRPSGKKDCWVHSYFPQTIKSWNTLPQQLVNIEDNKTFKQEIRGRVKKSVQPSFFSSHGCIYTKLAVFTSSMNLCLSCHVTWTVLHAWLHYDISIKTMHFGHC